MNRMKTSIVRGIILAFLGGSALAGEHGDLTVDLRLRVETADIDGLESADNESARLRLGYFTKAFHGLKFGAEGEFTVPVSHGSYNAAGVHGDAAKSVIADPESYDLDQLFAEYGFGKTSIKVGRQVITLDNHRFVGHVGWRQNRQTYDAVTIKDNTIDKLNLFYSYVDKVNRIFGSKAPSSGGNAGDTDSESHLINGSYTVSDALKVTLYAYLLELDDVPAPLSTDSYGISAQGTLPFGEEVKFGYLAEYAMQEEAGDNPFDYDADYIHLSANSTVKGIKVAVGYELLGSDQSGVDTNGAPVFASFKTPLATLHKFNGFADRFLVTPAKGLEDFYISVSTAIPVPNIGPVNATVAYHDFSTDEGGDDLGDEIDAVLVKAFKIDGVPGGFKAIAKYAAYSKGDTGADTDRFSFELNYSASF
ncbi:MAG: alginate export family protein [Verrucomicrobiota bacterium]